MLTQSRFGLIYRLDLVLLPILRPQIFLNLIQVLDPNSCPCCAVNIPSSVMRSGEWGSALKGLPRLFRAESSSKIVDSTER